MCCVHVSNPPSPSLLFALHLIGVCRYIDSVGFLRNNFCNYTATIPWQIIYHFLISALQTYLEQKTQYTSWGANVGKLGLCVFFFWEMCRAALTVAGAIVGSFSCITSYTYSHFVRSVSSLCVCFLCLLWHGGKPCWRLPHTQWSL